MTGWLDDVQWGTVGEWLGGLGGLLAAVVAVWIARTGNREATKNLDRQLAAERERARRGQIVDALIDHAEAAAKGRHAANLLLRRGEMPNNGPQAPQSSQRAIDAFVDLDAAGFEVERSRRHLEQLGLGQLLPSSDSASIVLISAARPSLAEDEDDDWVRARLTTTIPPFLRSRLDTLKDEMGRRETAALACLSSIQLN